MLFKVLDAMFGCRHSRYSFPITMRQGARRSSGAARTTYVVCLDCGKELPYDWSEMRVVEAQRRRPTPSLVTKEAA